MGRKPSYGELKQSVKELAKETIERKRAKQALRESEEKWHSLNDRMLGRLTLQRLNLWGVVCFG